jgi:hypothetical protein
VPDEDELAGEEVFEGDELLVFGDDGVGGLFPREADVDAEAVFGGGAFVAGLHDAGAGAGDDHVAGLDDLGAELDGLFVFDVVGLGAGGAEDGDLALLVIGRKDAEGVTEFADLSFTSVRILRAFSMMSATPSSLWPPPLNLMSSWMRRASSGSTGVFSIFFISY